MRRTLLALLLVAGAACSTLPEGQKATKPATGPAEVRAGTVEEHARQFDEEEPVRLAGSQEELAASAYVVAHLTDAGYVSRLDAVPVENLVRSTNVVALPPSGEEPDVLVVVAYDSTATSEPGGLAIGVWLEVARALRTIELEHSVQFVALGAEHAPQGGGRLGSRRLARQLTDEGRSPEVVVVEDVVEGDGPAALAGAAAAAIEKEARSLGIEVRAAPAMSGAGEVFDRAGFDTTVVGGGAHALGPVLLSYLAGL